MLKNALYLKIGILLLICSTSFSCRTRKPQKIFTGIFMFEQRPDDIFISASLVKTLKNKTERAFVVRVPNKRNNVVEEDAFPQRAMYYEMEQLLLKNGFKVFDRSLFKDAYEKSYVAGHAPDFILELSDYSVVPYYTNKVKPSLYDTTIKERQLKNFYQFNGAMAAIKIIDVKTTEIVGTFSMHFTPCTKGCIAQYTLEGELIDWNYNQQAFTANTSLIQNTGTSSDMIINMLKRLLNELKNQQ